MSSLKLCAEYLNTGTKTIEQLKIGETNNQTSALIQQNV